MPVTRPPYPAEYRAHIVRLYREGRSIASLAREFEPSSPTISSWISAEDLSAQQAAIAASTPPPHPPQEAERLELIRLRKELETVKMERDILEKAVAWFAKKTLP